MGAKSPLCLHAWSTGVNVIELNMAPRNGHTVVPHTAFTMLYDTFKPCII